MPYQRRSSLIYLFVFALSLVSNLVLAQIQTLAKHPNDHREYASFTLDNGLQVIVASDPYAKQSAFALSVEAGAKQDPQTQQGLAHYLEHVIFLGSNKYPRTNELAAFIEGNGGDRNAATYPDRTLYFASINQEQLPELLDRFAAAMTAPAFDNPALNNEVSAVDAEWRGTSQQEVFAHYLVGLHTAVAGNTPARMIIGNATTLSDKPGSALNQELRAFHQRFYTANRMNLVLIDSRSIEQLKQLAETHFAAIHAGQSAATEPLQPIQQQWAVGQHIYVKSKADNVLAMQFPIAELGDNWAARSGDYITRLLNSSAPSSLKAALKEQGWIASMGAIVSDGDDLNFTAGPGASLVIEFSLPSSSTKHTDDIVAATLAYIEKLRQQGINPEYAAELRRGLVNRAALRQPANNTAHARTLANTMVDVAAQLAVVFDAYATEFEPEEVKQLLDYLVPANMRLWHISKKGRTPKKLVYAKGSYGTEAFSDKDLANWQRSALWLELPALQNLEKVEAKTTPFDETFKTPQQVYRASGVRAFLQHNEPFHSDQGVLTMVLRNPYSSASVDNYTRSMVISDVFNDSNAEYISLAIEAMGVRPIVFADDFGNLRVQLSGNARYQPIVLKQLLQNFKALAFDKKAIKNSVWFRSGSVREKYIKQEYIPLQFPKFFGEFTQSAPYHFAFKKQFSSYWRASVKSVSEAHQQLVDGAYIDLYAAGNFAPDQLADIAQNLRSTLGASQVEQPWYFAADFHPEFGTSVVKKVKIKLKGVGVQRTYIYPEKSDQVLIQFRLLNQFLGSAFFNELRTEKKLGYVVASGHSLVHDYPAFNLAVESHNTDIEGLNGHFDEFVQTFAKQLLALSDERFNGQKNALIGALSDAPKNLGEATGPYITDWQRNRLDFDTRAKQIAYVSNTSKQDLITLYQQVFLEGHHALYGVEIKGK